MSHHRALTPALPLLPDVLDALFQDFPAGAPVVVLVGAAVSLEPPAALPAVSQFYRYVLNPTVAQLDRETIGAVGRLPAVASSVRFERLMQNIADSLRSSVPMFVPDLLSELFGTGAPNLNHEYLAGASNGRIALVLTTNFDQLIERCRPGIIRAVATEDEFAQLVHEFEIGSSVQPTVAHLHGSVGAKQTMAALMRQVGKPLLGARSALIKLLEQRGAYLISIGYSGRDDDIAPLLKPFRDQGHWFELIWKDQAPTASRRWVELNPTSPDFRAAIAALEAGVSRLKPPDRLTFLGAIAHSAGRGAPAAWRLRRSVALRPTVSARFAYAAALASEHFYVEAARSLADPPAADSALWAPWITYRAFDLRQSGKFHEAAADYAQVRQQLSSRLSGADDETLFLLIDAALHEIEARLLIASSATLRLRQSIIEECQHLLEECADWERQATQLPPMHELSYYAAELALLQGRPGDAVNQYRRFEASAASWDVPPAGIKLREAVALRAHALAVFREGHGLDAPNNWNRRLRGTAGMLLEAFVAWRAGLRAVIRSGSLMAFVQYLVIALILLGGPTHGYWQVRRLAAHLYPFYGALKVWPLRLRYPGFL